MQEMKYSIKLNLQYVCSVHQIACNNQFNLKKRSCNKLNLDIINSNKSYSTMMTLIFILCIIFQVFTNVVADAPPLLALTTQQYQFTGSTKDVVPLPTLISVKGNKPRSIKFQIKTIQNNNSGVPTLLVGKHSCLQL